MKHLIYMLFLLLLVTSCASQPKDPPPTGEPTIPELLVQLQLQADTIDNRYLNHTRLQQLRTQFEAMEEFDPEIQMELAVELLRTGETREAVALLEEMMAYPGVDEMTSPEGMPSVKELLAISYLRLGEQENCIQNHTAESCIFPIAGAGVYTLKEGPEKAAEIYLQILEKDPDNLSARHLLNLCYMTLGTWPAAVPAAYRIDPSAFASEYPLPRFTDVGMNLGVDVNDLSGGAIMEDFNRDGHMDLVCSSMDLKGQLRYFEYHNGQLMDHTVKAGLEGQVGGLNLIHADYNNDGFPDILVLRGAWFESFGKQPNSLLRNNGDGTFTDVTREAGILSFFPTQTATWADFNRDGHLDLFIANESTKRFQAPCELYISQGDGTFRNQTEAAGLTAQRFYKGVAAGDYDNDGFPDLYLSAYGAENQLYHNLGLNESGQVIFEEIAAQTGVQEPIFSFPVWFWDYDNDGWEDIFVSGYEFRKQAPELIKEYLGREIDPSFLPCFYHNNGDGTFTNNRAALQMERNLFAMGCNYGDLDNDGYQDFYIGTGAPEMTDLFPNRMFRSMEGQYFQDVTTAGGFGHLQKGHGIAFGDIDNDGDQDIYHTLGGAYVGDVFQNALFLNPGTPHNNWITLELEGTQSNRMGIGARLTLVISEPLTSRRICRTISTGSSFGASSLQAEIGLGASSEVDSLIVYWPASDTRQVFTGVEAGEKWKITEGENTLKIMDYQVVDLLKPAGDGGHHHHH